MTVVTTWFIASCSNFIVVTNTGNICTIPLFSLYSHLPLHQVGIMHCVLYISFLFFCISVCIIDFALRISCNCSFKPIGLKRMNNCKILFFCKFYTIIIYYNNRIEASVKLFFSCFVFFSVLSSCNLYNSILSLIDSFLSDSSLDFYNLGIFSELLILISLLF